MDPEREKIEDLMNRYGVEEPEARILYHLAEAEDLFDSLYEPEPGRRASTAIFKGIYIQPHFYALRKQLGMRVLGKDYPEGWGRPPEPAEES